MNTHSSVKIHALVKGSVQGVGFRAASQRIAKRLHLTGTVENLDDGSVEIYVQGDKNSILSFFDELKTGAKIYHISELIMNEISVINPRDDFYII